MSKFSGWIIGFLAFLLPLALYVKTLAPTYIPVDSGEFTLCAKFLGICHPPGFPLYTLKVKIFAEIWPFGSLIYKANLFSAIFGALTILVVYLILVRLSLSKILALLSVLVLAVSKVFWEFSLSADVFTFGVFLLVLSIFLLFSSRRGPVLGWENKSLIAFFVLGLSASHFYITGVLLPVFVWYGLRWSKRTINFMTIINIIKIILVFCLGFLPQVLMFWRMQADPVINWGHIQNLSEFISFVRREEFGGFFVIDNPILKFSLVNLGKHFYVYFQEAFVNYVAIIILALLTVILTLRRLLDKMQIFLFLSFLLLLIFQMIALSNIDPKPDSFLQISKFYLPSFTVIFIFFASFLKDFASKISFQNQMWIVALLGFWILISLMVNFKHNDFSKKYDTEKLVLDSFSQLPKSSVAVVLDHAVYFGARYEQEENGKFKGVTIAYFPNENNRDIEKYNPSLFKRAVDLDFVSKVQEGKGLNPGQRYVLEFLSRDFGRPVFIRKGDFEEGFFKFISDHLVDDGLWWRLERVESQNTQKTQ